jgi:uncharacterized protein (TIGR02145 family)
VPADFVKNNQSYILNENDADYNAGIVFACIAKYANGSYNADTLDIEFIGTNTAGYGTANGVKYITLQSGSGSTLKVALLSLGQGTDTKDFKPTSFTNSDAGDLGDFYQWGRVADGHEHVVWKKGTNHQDSIVPMIGGANNTSAVIAYSSLAIDATSAAANYDTYSPNNNTPFHQVKSDTPGYGKFIFSNSAAADGYYQWYNPGYNTSSNDNYLWGQSGQSATNRNPVKNGNDPCPPNWKVPSRWQFIDIYDGNGTSSTTTAATTWAGGANNAWGWRDASSTNAVGGAVITNASGEKLFLPAAGNRDASSGALNNIGIYGSYWSSTYNSNYSYLLSFYNNFVYAGARTISSKAYGMSIRCVAE